METGRLSPHPDSLELLTVTWAGDAEQFRLLRTSLARSALVDLPHRVVVHTEDLPLFTDPAPSLDFRTTAQVLPGNLETLRLQARDWQRRLGRHGTKWMSSLTRAPGGPSWPRYLGWHVQQISKLACVAQSEATTVLVLDSDVIVTAQARVADFLHPSQAVCLERFGPAHKATGKVGKWNRTAHHLLEVPLDAEADVDLYFDTPFPMHPPSVRALMAWLENRYQQPWWQTLLAQPPRRWSEFATYRLFLRQHPPASGIKWMAPTLTRYVYDATDPDALIKHLHELMIEPDCHYVTLHSQSSGRGLWDAKDVIPKVSALFTADT